MHIIGFFKNMILEKFRYSGLTPICMKFFLDTP
jgi:hypothetical protein